MDRAGNPGAETNAVSPLAEAVYEVLRRRTMLPGPRLTYAELAAAVRGASADFEHVTHRSRPLYAALGEVGDACRRLDLPPLPALVVRADTRRPGDAYYGGKCSGVVPAANPVAAWWRDLEAVKGTAYPPRGRQAAREGE
jgi:hypothetical protein